QAAIGIAERGNRGIEPVGLACASSLAKRGEPRTQRTISVGYGVGGGRQASCRGAFSRRNRLHRPSAPSWSRAAGIAEHDDAALAEPDARRDRDRAWTVIQPD